MIKTQEELSKAIKYLNKRSMSCNVTDNPPSKAIIKALSEDMTVEDFNNDIVPKLDFENKYKLGSMLRQYRYNKDHPKKSLKISKELADRFDELRGDMTVDKFVSLLLDNFQS